MSFSSDKPLLSNQLPISIDFPNPDDKEFNDTLTLTYKRIADSMNSKEGALYLLNELANFRLFYTANNPQVTRNSYRKVFDMVILKGANIGPTETVDFAHNIVGIFNTDFIYASCTTAEATPRFFTVVFPNTYLDTTKVWFINPLAVDLKQCIVVANYLKN